MNTTEQQVTGNLTVDATIETFNRTAFLLALSRQYGFPLSWFSAEALGGSLLANALASLRYGGPLPGVAAGDALARQVDAALRARLESFFTPFNRRLKKATGVGWTYDV